MRKFVISLTLLTLGFTTAAAQTRQMLDEVIVRAVEKALPNWKAENPSKNFKGEFSSERPVISAKWKVPGTTQVTLTLNLAQNLAEYEQRKQMFVWRSIVPPNRPIYGLAKETATLVEIPGSIEILFLKENVVVSLDFSFEDTRPNKKRQYYAPAREIEKSVKFARVIAAAIEGQRTVDPCRNDFFLPPSTIPEPAVPTEIFSSIAKNDVEKIKANLRLPEAGSLFTEKGENLVHLAVKQGCLETLKLVANAGIDVNRKDSNGISPLMLAANLGETELIRYLLSAGADIHAKDIYGRNAAFFAIGNRQYWRFDKFFPTLAEKRETLKLLISEGLSITAKETWEEQSLLTFRMNGLANLDLVRDLLDLGSDINDVDKYGESALFKAVSRINPLVSYEFVEMLVKRGADVNARAGNGQSPLSYLESRIPLYKTDKSTIDNLNKLILFLQAAGAKR